jgi:hypothetical protein
MPAHGPPKDEIIERRDRIKLGRRHPELIGDVMDAFVGYPTAVLLHDPERFDARGFLEFAALQLGVYFIFFFVSKHKVKTFDTDHDGYDALIKRIRQKGFKLRVQVLKINPPLSGP